MKIICPICETTHKTKPYTDGLTCKCGNRYTHCRGWLSDDKKLAFNWLKALVLEKQK